MRSKKMLTIVSLVLVGCMVLSIVAAGIAALFSL